jgi:hypothetical protein
MTANKHFNISRFKNIFKRELHSNLKFNLLIIGAMFSIFTIIIFLVFQFGNKPTSQEVLDEFHIWTFGIMLYVGGIFISSFSFADLRSKMKAHFYLLTPCSNFEKFLANLLISLFGYMIFMFVAYFAYSHLFNWIVEAAYNIPFKDIDYSNKELLIAINVFVFVHSMFYLGSVSFKKYPLILTPIATFIMVSALMILSQILKKIIFPGVDIDSQVNNVHFEDFFNTYQSIGRVILFYVLPPIFWYMTYLKLNEKEF